MNVVLIELSFVFNSRCRDETGAYIELVLIEARLQRAHHGVLGERTAQVDEVVDVPGRRARARARCRARSAARRGARARAAASPSRLCRVKRDQLFTTRALRYLVKVCRQSH